MNIARRLTLIIILIAALAGIVVPTLAAEKTVTITETDINSTYRATNPIRRTVSNVYVDIQTDQVVITANFTARGKDPVAVSATMTASITNGRIYWSVTSATANGVSASGDVLTQINNSIASSWRTYIKTKADTGKVTSIAIGSDAISWTKVSP